MARSLLASSWPDTMSLTSRDDSVDLIDKSRDSHSESVASGGDNNNNTDNSPLTTLVCPEGTLEGSEVSDDRQSDDRGSFFGASGANRSIPDNVNGLIARRHFIR